MAQMQELTRFMLAAGGAKPPGSKSTHLLYNEDSSLILKGWNGTTFGLQELIATDALPDSPVVFLLPLDTDKRIVYIKSALTLGSLLYDPDDQEWVEDEEFGEHKDPSNQLIHLDDEWTPTILPAKAVAGSSLLNVELWGEGILRVICEMCNGF